MDKVGKRSWLAFAFAAMAALAMSAVCSASTAWAAELTADSTESLATAVASANEGDTILVTAENVEFPAMSTKNLTLKTTVGTKVTEAGSVKDGTTIDGFEYSDHIQYNASDVTIRNCVFTGTNGFRWAYAYGTWLIESCKFQTSIYGIHFDGGNGIVNVTNCEISGFNTFASSLSAINFTSCTFKGLDKNLYSVCQVRSLTTINNCVFEESWAQKDTDKMFVGNAEDAVTEVYSTTYASESILGMPKFGGSLGVLVVDPVKTEAGLYSSGTFLAEPSSSILAEGTCTSQDDQGHFVVAVHELEDVAGKAPTYEELGYAAYKVCPNCGEKEGWTEIAKLDPPVANEPVSVDETVIQAAISEAAASGSQEVVVNVSDAPEAIKEVALSNDSLGALAEGGSALTVKTPQADVTMDAAAIQEIATQASGEDVILSVTTELDTEALNDDQKAAVASADVKMVISAELIAGGKVIHDFNGGTVTVSIPFKLAEGETADQFSVLYVAADGSVQVIPSEYDAEAELLVVKLSHFSEYVVAKDYVVSEAEGGDKPGADKPGSGVNGSSNGASDSTGASAPAATLAKTGDSMLHSAVLAIVAATAAAAIAHAALRRRTN